MPKESGGFAFPTSSRYNNGAGYPMVAGGITVWDYYAAAAVQGLLASGCDPARVSEDAAKVANRMIKEREKE